jgi:hypothetical protein
VPLSEEPLSEYVCVPLGLTLRRTVGELLRGIEGVHLYEIVADMSDVPETVRGTLRVLEQEKLWVLEKLFDHDRRKCVVVRGSEEDPDAVSEPSSLTVSLDD